MSSPTHRSESNLRRYGKPARKKSTPLYSDYYDERDDSDSHHLVSTQRSVSLTALHPIQMPPVTLEPRMAQLETLEAKMASIEVSLSTTPRRKKNGNGVQTLHRTYNGTTVTNSAPVSIPTPVVPIQSQEPALKDVVTRELESLRNTLKDKENVIQSLKGQLCISRLSATYLTGGSVGGTSHNTQPLSDKERRAAEERLQRLRHEMDNKRVAIKNLKIALERLDITDNIDVRIQQAELEYQLGREELNLLTLLEESRGLQLCLELRATSIFSCVSGSGHVTLHAVELNYDPKSPRFGAGPREGSPGFYVEWAAEDSGMIKGDRLLEVNGKVVLTLKGGKEDLARLLAASPVPAQIVVLRKSSSEQELRARATEAERLKETFRADNLRLTHRISYLEEQVAELQQKGVEEKDGETGVLAESHSSSAPSPATSCTSGLQVFQKGPQVTALVAGAGLSSPVESRHSLPTVRSSTKSHDIRSAKSLDLNSDSSHHHHHHHHHHQHRHHLHCQQQLQNAKSITSLQHLDKQHDARSVRSLDLDSDLQQTRTQRPTPPKKPLRLSLQRATSLQSVSPCSSPNPGSGSHKPTKRNHKGEAPQPPPPARSVHSALRWHSPAAALHHLKAAQHRLTVNEKWC